MSPSDDLMTAQAKMAEYGESGVRLGWLIDRKQRRVWIYRVAEAPQVLDKPATLSGAPVLPDFMLDTSINLVMDFRSRSRCGTTPILRRSLSSD